MKLYKMFKYLLFVCTIISCNSISKTRYSNAYKVISADFLSKETSIEQFGKDISGVYIFDSIYANPLDNKNYNDIYKNILSENKIVKPLKESKDLKELSKKNLNSNWKLQSDFRTVFTSIVQYDSIPNGPLNSAIFSEIVDNQLRVDIVPFFIGNPKYCGSITKYYFKFEKTKIIQSKKWKDNYECW